MRLAKILQLKRRNVLDQLKSKRSFVWIARKTSPDKIKAVKALGIEGIGFTTESRRYYPGREIASHLIGFVGEDNQGLEGLEKKYDGILTGPKHTLIQLTDAVGRPFFVSRPATHGDDMRNLVLTIDKDIQYKAQQALKTAVEKTRAKSGQCVVVNPETGEILAMAVVPLFNPNVFRKYRPYQWRNRIVTDIYEPGSAIKAFLLAAALEEKIVSLETTFDCENGKFKVGNHVIHDTKEHGTLSVPDIIARSSNIGAVKIGHKLGYEKFSAYLKRFGFGEKTGIGLLGERLGFIRPADKAKEIDKATIFFGQGMSATSIQLAMAIGAIANGGKLMRPYVVKSITDQKGGVIKKTHPKVIRRALSPEVSKKVTKVLEGVVSEEGTGSAAAITGYRVAGKTGTSQKVDPKTKKYSRKNYVAVFVGFVPVDKPKLVILIAVDEPKGVFYGGPVAGPVFREVGAWTLNHLRINPQLRLVGVEESPELSDVRRQILDPEPVVEIKGPGRLPDFRGQNMREVLKGGRSLGLTVVLEGTGFAFKQVPAPGSSIKKIKTVKVAFRPPM
jgi:cell division protein FtsI (penicillin-binding protein 3)